MQTWKFAWWITLCPMKHEVSDNIGTHINSSKKQTSSTNKTNEAVSVAVVMEWSSHLISLYSGFFFIYTVASSSIHMYWLCMEMYIFYVRVGITQSKPRLHVASARCMLYRAQIQRQMHHT